jgi:hypothetical protein
MRPLALRRAVRVAPLTDDGRTFASSLYTAATENLVREFWLFARGGHARAVAVCGWAGDWADGESPFFRRKGSSLAAVVIIWLCFG